MKFNKKIQYELNSEVKKRTAPKGRIFAIYVEFAAKEISRKKLSEMRQFFNSNGAICIGVKTLYQVYEENRLVCEYIYRKNAIKHARNYLKDA